MIRKFVSRGLFLPRSLFSFCSPTIATMHGPRAWVVQCNECGCIVTCRAEDPQAHLQDPEPRPACRLLVTCSCCWTSWLYPPEAMFNGSPAPSPECYRRARNSARTENAKLIAASVIAAIRLNREDITNSPAVHAKINDSLKLAELIVAKMSIAVPKN